MDVVRHFLQDQPLWLIGVGLFAMLAGAAWMGRSWRARLDLRQKEAGDPSVIISASLGLMALLLGFTVSMAVTRFDNRRAAVVAEANAIGTFLLRADLMPADQRAMTLTELGAYVEARTLVSAKGINRAGVEEAQRLSALATAAMWRHVLIVRATVDDPATRILLVESANEMFDMASARDAAIDGRLPSTLLLLLLIFPAASMVLIGYASGRSVGIHFLASTEMILLLTLTLLLVLDLDRPRAGTIRTNDQPLIDVQEQVLAAIVATGGTPGPVPAGAAADPARQSPRG